MNNGTYHAQDSSPIMKKDLHIPGFAPACLEESQPCRCPRLAVLIPAYNRQAELPDCLTSVLSQNQPEIEVIVVDDCSEDDSKNVVRSFCDNSLRFLQLSENVGVCAARFAGTYIPKSPWILKLDTDWRLLPGSLDKLLKLTSEVPPTVGVVGGCAVTDTGQRWPKNNPPQGTFGFSNYCQWVDTDGPTDYLSCRRRLVHKEIPWPIDRRLEMGFHWRIASAWQFHVIPDVLAVALTTSPNRISADRSSCADLRKLRMSAAVSDDATEVLETFGSQIKKLAPLRYRHILFVATLYSFISRRRARGLLHGIRLISTTPTNIKYYGLVVLGLLGPRVLFNSRQILRKLGISVRF